MGKNFTAVFAVCLAISALPLACGDDEEPNGGGGGKGGSAGKGGKGGTSGSSGTSGNGGTAGTSTGGRSGSSGAAGTSTGGTTPGGMGGIGGDDGGMGGGGGDDNPMTACGRLCERAEAANCPDNSTCQYDMCDALMGIGCDAEVTAMIECGADGASAASFSCSKYDTPVWDPTSDCYTEYEAVIACI